MCESDKGAGVTLVLLSCVGGHQDCSQEQSLFLGQGKLLSDSMYCVMLAYVCMCRCVYLCMGVGVNVYELI